jgi:hypothetical protein
MGSGIDKYSGSTATLLERATTSTWLEGKSRQTKAVASVGDPARKAAFSPLTCRLWISV